MIGMSRSGRRQRVRISSREVRFEPLESRVFLAGVRRLLRIAVVISRIRQDFLTWRNPVQVAGNRIVKNDSERFGQLGIVCMRRDAYRE
jgi:hypothetical protein